MEKFGINACNLCSGRCVKPMATNLLSQASVTISVYQSFGATPCLADDHQQLHAALQASDRSAVKLIRYHLTPALDDLDRVETCGRRVYIRSVLTHVD